MKNFDISNLLLTSLCDVRRVKHDTSFGTKAQASHCALILRRAGLSFYRSKNKTYRACADTVLFVVKGTEYTMTVEESGEALVIEFDIAEDQLEKQFKGGAILEYFSSADKHVTKIAKSLLQYYVLRGPAYSSKCFSELYSLLTQISTVHAYNRSLAGKYGLIHSSVKFIESNYPRQDMYTPMLAEISGIGETYYRTIFQAVFNMPPARYIQLYRISKAKELLLGSDKSVETIATAVGFANASYFCKVFKSLTGVTPSEFAQSCKTLG